MKHSSTVRRGIATAAAVVPIILLSTPAHAATTVTTVSGSVFARWLDTSNQKTAGFGNRHMITLGATTENGVTSVFGSIQDQSCKADGGSCVDVGFRTFTGAAAPASMVISSDLRSARLTATMGTIVSAPTRGGEWSEAPGADVAIDLTWSATADAAVVTSKTRSGPVTVTTSTLDSSGGSLSGTLDAMNTANAVFATPELHVSSVTTTDQSAK